MLSIDRIFASNEFSDEGFDRPRWWDEGNFYTTLQRLNEITAVHGDLTATTTADTSHKNTSVFEIIWHDASSGASGVMVSAAQLTPPNNIPAAQPLSIDDYKISSDKKSVLIFTNAQKVWRLKTRGSYWVLNTSEADSLRPLGNGNCDLMFATFSPSGNQVAYVRQNNIYYEDLLSHHITQVTFDGSENIINGTFDWVYEEEFHLRNGFRWSPDGSKIAFWQVDQSQVPIVHLINNTDHKYPILIPIHYPKTGETNASVKIGVATVQKDGCITTWIDIPGDKCDNYIADMEFNKFTGELVLQQLNRQQNNLKVLLIDLLNDNTISTIFIDHDDAWVEMNHELRWVRNGAYFFFISEMGGWRQIYLIEKSNTSHYQAITPIDFDVDILVGVDEEEEYVYFTASPNDPIRRYLYRCSYGNNKTPQFERITPSDDYIGTNSYSMSRDGKYAVHTYSSCSTPTITSIVNLPSHHQVASLAKNKKLLDKFNEVNSSEMEFFRLDITEAITLIDDGYQKSIEVNNTPTILDGWCIYPPDFDSSKKYPVIFHVYGEPAAQIVRDQWGGKIHLWHRMLAEQGAVIICVDNRGTPAPRGRAWRKIIYGKIGQLASIDQAAAAYQLLQNRPYLDPTKVAIWGWSGGGSMSLNMLFRYPNLYKTAVSIAPVPDMRLYDTIYQERYMNLPQLNESGYLLGSPVNFVENMKETQNLLIIHGTGDDNCHYQGTEILINQLVKHNKPFQMIAYPNRSHSISEGANTTRHLFQQITRFLKQCELI
eukprot:gene16546-22593_t